MLTLGGAQTWLDGMIARDGAFSSLGFVSHDYPNLLVFVEDERFLSDALANQRITCAFATPDLAARLPGGWGVAITPHPRRSFYRLHEGLLRDTGFYGASTATTIAQSASIHSTAVVAGMDVTIGEDAVIEPRVVIRGRVTIGEGAVVGAGSVVGSDGFQVQVENGAAWRVAHAGRVRIGRRAYVHANCCVDRALFGGETVVGDETTLDSLVYVAHDARIGRLCRVGAGAAINGSAAIGDEVWIGPNATISGGVTVGARARISLGSVVTRNVEADTRVSGNFAIAHERFLDHLRTIR